MRENKTFLQSIALAMAPIGALSSIYFLLKASRHQSSILLILLFTVWVLLPFTGLIFATKIYKRSTVRSRNTIYWLTIIVGVGSMVAYSGILMPENAKFTFTFLIVPLISLSYLIIAILTVQKLNNED